MKRIITGITAAAVSALLLFSGAARADEPCERREWRDPGERRGEGWHQGWRWREEEWRERHAQWWRERRLRELEGERRAFYAHWDGNPWRRARFERYCARRREELRHRY